MLIRLVRATGEISIDYDPSITIRSIDCNCILNITIDHAVVHTIRLLGGPDVIELSSLGLGEDGREELSGAERD